MPVIGSTLLALASALSYGASDFIGGRAATRLPTIATLACAQLAACGLAMLVAHGISAGPIPASMLMLGAAGGLCHVAAVGMLYHGLAHGRITVVAPLSGVLNIVLPVFVDGVVLNHLGMLQCTGILLSGVAVCLVTRGAACNSGQNSRLGVSIGLGAASGLLFGLSDLSLGSVEPQAAGDAVLVARLVGATGVGLAVIVVYRKAIADALGRLLGGVTVPGLELRLGPAGGAVRDRRTPSRSTIATGVVLALLAGASDCLGHVAYVLSASTGAISVAVATSALFPAVSVLLAILILKESVGRLQSLGLGISIGAVAMLAGA